MGCLRNLVGFLAALGTLAPTTAWAQADVLGEWRTLSYLMPINPIHASILRTGKILIVAGSENDPTVTTYRTAVMDPRTGSIEVQAVPWDLFCNGMSHLPDGRVLVTGGTIQYEPTFQGIRTTTIFDPQTQRFIQVQDMARGRWYPTNTTLADGRTKVFSGLLETPGTNNAVEIYDASLGWSPEYVAPWVPPLYPWPHLLPSGDVFVSGPIAATHLFRPASLSWVLNHGTGKTYTTRRLYGSSVLLPLDPADGYRPRVVILGGTTPTATSTAELIDLSAAAPTWQGLPSMAYARVQQNATILPTGTVLVTGGSSRDKTASTASLVAELLDPATLSWRSLAAAAYPRLYHSVALLLPDATVWTAGSNPATGTWEPRMEIYSPPYLFTRNGAGQVVPAPRPSITAAPARIGYGETFEVTTPEAADIASVALVRPGATTHAFDMEQRMVRLSHTALSAGSLAIDSPALATVAPPGYYMLFLVDAAGVPSVAAFVQLSTHPDNASPRGTIAQPASDVTVTAGSPVTFAGAGADDDGTIARYSWVFPGGVPAVSTASSPGPVVFSKPGTYIVSLTVTDDVGATDPSPPARVITVMPAADLATTAVANPPAAVAIGSSLAVSDTVTNLGAQPAGASTTRYYLSLDAARNAGDVLLQGARAVPVLAAGQTSTGGAIVIVPAATPPGTYRLLACANDTAAVVEVSGLNNCAAAAAPVVVGVPGRNLVTLAVSSPPASVARRSTFAVTDTVVNQGIVRSRGTRTRYYLSLDLQRSPDDRKLGGYRLVPPLLAGAVSTGTAVVTVPGATPLGTYHVLACADDIDVALESNETDNCAASSTRVTITP